MQWKKDNELFADIDENGKLFSDEFTQMMLEGSAADQIKGYGQACGSVPSQAEKERAAADVFVRMLRDIRGYVAEHNHIGAFPPTKDEIRLECWSTYQVREPNPDYDPELAEENRQREARHRAIEGLKDRAQREAWVAQDSLDYGAEGALGINLAIDQEMDKVNRAAEEAHSAVGEVSGGNSPYITRTERRYHGKEMLPFCFFDHLTEGFWQRNSEILPLQQDRETDHFVTRQTLLRAPLWLLPVGCVLLAWNLAWGLENPLSALLVGRMEPRLALAVLFAVGAVALLLLSLTKDYVFHFVDFPAAAFFCPVLFGAVFGVDEVLQERGCPEVALANNIISVVMVVSLLVLAIQIFRAVGLKGLAISAFVMVCLLYFGIQLHTEQKIALYGALGLLALFVAVNVAAALTMGNSDNSWKRELLKAVNENALTEYKALRFIRLWIVNADLRGKKELLAIVDREEQLLKARVAEAEGYAKARRLHFEPV